MSLLFLMVLIFLRTGYMDVLGYSRKFSQKHNCILSIVKKTMNTIILATLPFDPDPFSTLLPPRMWQSGSDQRRQTQQLHLCNTTRHHPNFTCDNSDSFSTLLPPRMWQSGSGQRRQTQLQHLCNTTRHHITFYTKIRGMGKPGQRLWHI